MKTDFNYTIGLIGSGKVATSLASAFYKNGIKISQVWSMRRPNALKLSKKINAEAIRDLQKMNADIYLVAVKDDAISEIVKKIPGKNPVILHTSGSVPLAVLKKKSVHCGVIYPLQTFTGKNPANFKDIPLLTEATDKKTEKIIRYFVSKIGKRSYPMNSNQREKVHLSAVMVSNFPNYFYALAENILQKEKISFEILIPLIQKVTENLLHSAPSENQTGPAIRKDGKTLKRHLALLKNEKETQKIYKLLSYSIMNHSFSKPGKRSKLK